MENISKHITYDEATKSQTAVRLGLKNDPGPKELSNMKKIAEEVFEPLREHFNKPIAISSFFRSTGLNKAIGGASNSQHVKGEAIDIDAEIKNNGVTNKDVFDYIRKNLQFDQLIAEFGDSHPSWIHVSFSTRNRKEILIAEKIKGRTIYHPYSEALYIKIYGK